MIYREYLTEYEEYSHCIKHSINISTDNFHVFKTIKAYAESVCENAESVCENEDDLKLREESEVEE